MKSMPKASPKKSGASSAVGITMGLVAAAAVAGAYFLFNTSKGKKVQRQLRGWMLKVQGEVMERVEQLSDVSQAAYNRIVDEVSTKYLELGTVDSAELKNLQRELKGRWGNIKRELAAGSKSVKKSAPKLAKR